ncbi:hypothetical protein DE146DRAFT_634868 [Phaeosphaeria sp. MPI-PUGE-AT-0046c]|nr:hypothetical protein DE146DRAFT_634868 [Phaeosphaeria sp. MPI-PUGE-AT-0046c]
MSQHSMHNSLPTVLANPTTDPNVAEAFGRAKKNFLDTLTSQERAQFASCESAAHLLSDFEKRARNLEPRRALPSMRRIRNFGDRLGPYFKVIEIVCQSNPEWTCIAWGAFRLVLQVRDPHRLPKIISNAAKLANNFTTFFEKLSKLIESLTMKLPQYAEFYETLCSGNSRFSPRLQGSLVEFYVDIFEFFQAIARVFSRPDGRLKRSPVVIAELFWRPFDVRFQDLLDRMTFHQEVLDDELKLAGMKDLRSMLKAQVRSVDDARIEARENANLTAESSAKLSEDIQRTFRASIVQWLSPPPFKDSFEKANYIREEGTTEWLFDDPLFKTWECSETVGKSDTGIFLDSVLWIRGNPGWGKTVVAASTVCKLESKLQGLGEDSVVCYYFFNQADPLKSSSTRAAAYRAIAEQIFQKCHRNEVIHDMFALANDGSKSLASERELLDLLGLVVPILSNLYLVLDGIDECSEVEDLTDDVHRFCGTSSAKVILFSRPHVEPLRQSLKSKQIVTMSREVLNKDLHTFVCSELDAFRLKNRFPLNADYRSIEETIVEKADGMFLWARLMIGLLKSPALTKSARMRMIFNTTPVGLKDMYDRILDQILHMDEASQKLASTVFTWTAYAFKNLTSEEFGDAVYPADAGDDASEKADFVNHAVIVVCCGLIEKRQNTLSFIHLTARDHILSLNARNQNGFVLPPEEAHTTITMTCLKYLLFSVPAQPLSGNLLQRASPDHISSEYPLLSYAASHWSLHLENGLTALETRHPNLPAPKYLSDTISMIQKFLGFPLNIMVWIEAVYLFPEVIPIRSLEVCASLMQGSLKTLLGTEMFRTSEDLILFASDMQSIQADWGFTLQDSPQDIWNDVSSFSNSRFLCQNQGLTFETMAPGLQNHTTDRKDPFICIGRKGGECIGKLTIFASSLFNRLWKTPKQAGGQDPLHSVSDYHECCSNWIALYEIHKIQEGNEVVFSQIMSLDAEEIALQMQFSLRLSPFGHQKFKFPLAIGPNLRTIAVLRSITTFDIDCSRLEQTKKHHTNVPNLSHSERFRSADPGRTLKPTLPYSYDWLFTYDSLCAVFRDYDMNNGKGSMGVFRLQSCASGIESTLIELREFNEDSNGSILRMCAVHPLEQKMIMLNHDVLEFLDLEQGLHFSTTVSNDRSISALEFSQCGNYYVIHRPDVPVTHLLPEPSHSRLDIRPIPWEPSNRPISKKRPSQETLVANKRRLADKNKTLQRDASSTPLDLPSTTNSSLSVVDDTSKTVISISPRYDWQTRAKRIDIHSRGFGQSEGTSSSLVRLPDRTDVRNINASLQTIDDEHGHRVRIVITPEVRPTYESDEPTISKHLPAVIHRDVSLLQWKTSRNSVPISLMLNDDTEESARKYEAGGLELDF